ncbi:hypothetical protein HDU98_010005, partial [Podochytrium sp. JEL0797]
MKVPRCMPKFRRFRLPKRNPRPSHHTTTTTTTPFPPVITTRRIKRVQNSHHLSTTHRSKQHLPPLPVDTLLINDEEDVWIPLQDPFIPTHHPTSWDPPTRVPDNNDTTSSHGDDTDSMSSIESSLSQFSFDDTREEVLDVHYVVGTDMNRNLVESPDPMTTCDEHDQETEFCWMDVDFEASRQSRVRTGSGGTDVTLGEEDDAVVSGKQEEDGEGELESLLLRIHEIQMIYAVSEQKMLLPARPLAHKALILNTMKRVMASHLDLFGGQQL